MLVLTRTQDEAIMIGDHIEVTVLEVRGDRVRIGIRAPQEVTIHRKEVYQAIQEANVEAARLGESNLDRLKEMGRTLTDRRKRPVPAEGGERKSGEKSEIPPKS